MPRNSKQQMRRYVETLVDPIGRRLESVRQWLAQGGSLVLLLLEAAGGSTLDDSRERLEKSNSWFRG